MSIQQGKIVLFNNSTVCNQQALRDLEQNNPVGFSMLEPDILSALLSTRLNIDDISKKLRIPTVLLNHCVELWKIDVEKIHNDALEKSIDLANETNDAASTPYIKLVRNACEILGWDKDDFIKKYKAFVANRQGKKAPSRQRPLDVKDPFENHICEINLLEYLLLWVEAGRASFFDLGKSKLNENDQESKALQVCRQDHDEHYFFSNCFIDKQSTNVREAVTRGRQSRSTRNRGVVINGMRYKTRAEGKEILGKSEEWLRRREGDYESQTYNIDEPKQILRESLDK
jgi:hypothetical protein